MAAAFLRARAEKSGDALRIESAGTWGVDGQGASPLAQQVMQQRGLSMDGHVARTITREMLDAADVILVMTRSHRDALAAEFPASRSKTYLASQLVGLDYDIADPYGGPREAYETCAFDLASLFERGYPRLQAWLAAPERLPNV